MHTENPDPVGNVSEAHRLFAASVIVRLMIRSVYLKIAVILFSLSKL